MVTKISAAPFAFIAILVGALVPILFVIAMFTDGYWEFNVNTLSDLGVSYNETAAAIFNYTCMVAGVLIAIYGIGRMFIKQGYDAASGILVAIGGMLLVAIGIVNESYSAHIMIACSFFAIMAIAIFVGAAGDVKNNRTITVAITAMVVVIVLAAAIGFTIAGLEVVSVIAMCVWLIAQGFALTFSKA